MKKNIIKFFLCVFSCAFLIACSEGNVHTEREESYTYWKDDLGREVKIKKGAKRFLPLAPSVTEMLSLICDTSEIVGRTQNCNYPPLIMQKPVVNNYPPDLEKILFLKPDLVITKDGMLSIAQAEAIQKMGIPVYFQKYEQVEDIFSGLEKLSQLTGHGENGRKIADSLRLELRKSSSEIIGLPRKKILMLISNESYFVFGKDTYASDIVWRAGGVNAVDSVYSNAYPVLTAEYILKTDPDIMIGGAQVGLEKDFFELHKELKRTKAYRNKQYFVLDDDYLSRPGPRVVEAVRRVKELLHQNNENSPSK